MSGAPHIPVTKTMPTCWQIQIIPNGRCDVREDVLFADRFGHTGTYPFVLYLFALRGKDQLALVDTGPKEVDSFNQSTAMYIPSGIVQAPEERTPAALACAGIDPAQVNLVILTHLHYDHCSYVSLFPNARVVANRRGFLAAFPHVPREILEPLMPDWPHRLHLAEDEEELAPGLSVLWTGGHSLCSQVIFVDTTVGRVAICGDVVFYYENLEADRPIGWADPKELRPIMNRIRQEADLILPGHDPAILVRHPSRRIGAEP